MRDAWDVLAGRFPEVEPGKRANRYMSVERERVIKEMERKSIDANKAARKRWDKDATGMPDACAVHASGTGDAMQDTDTE